MNLKINSTLQKGRYIITKVLGQGGFGITYVGIDVKLDREICIKEFFMKALCDRDETTSMVTTTSENAKETVEKFRKKFIKEAQTISRLKNVHVVSIYDVFEENGTAYYVMDLLKGGSLKDRIEEYGPMKEEHALLVMGQVCDALSYIHQHRTMHLDIKPTNIMLRDKDSSNVTLIDFGISKRYDSSGEQTSSTPVGISKGYAPLEQYNQGGVQVFSPATDVYSVGATLYFLLTGNTPPEANSVLENGIPELPKSVSSKTRKAIKCAMNPRRQDRPQSIIDFEKLLGISVEHKEEPAETQKQFLIDNKWRWFYWIFFPAISYINEVGSKKKFFLSYLLHPIFLAIYAYLFASITENNLALYSLRLSYESAMTYSYLAFILLNFIGGTFFSYFASINIIRQLGIWSKGPIVLSVISLISFGFAFGAFVILSFVVSLILLLIQKSSVSKWEYDKTKRIVSNSYYSILGFSTVLTVFVFAFILLLVIFGIGS